MSRAREEHGFSLIEMVVVCLILGVVLTGITTVFVSGTHSELNLNNRFQAQQAARLALDAIRADAHGARAANMTGGGATLVLALVPQPVSGVVYLNTCGAAANAGYTKVVWCALNSPTVTGQYALYRSPRTTDSLCTAANGKLEADNLTSNNVFGPTATVTVSQLQTLTATIAIKRQTGTAGMTYKLSEPLTLRNSVYQTTASTACLTDPLATACQVGLYPYLDATGNPSNAPCYPPAIQ